MQMLHTSHLQIPLILVGPVLSRNERDLISATKLDGQVQQVFLDDTRLKRAYANCTAVVQTSRYEGFGMTPLEGMASGVPVVAAAAASMPEVGGDVAQYFRPGDAEDLASTLTRLLSDDDLRATLGRQGVERAQLFSLEKIAARTAAVYEGATKLS